MRNPILVFGLVGLISMLACGGKGGSSTAGGTSGGTGGTSAGDTAGSSGGSSGGTSSGTTGGPTDVVAPTVVLSPADGATEVAADVALTLQFSEAIAATTINSTSVIIDPPTEGTMSYDSANFRVTIVPTGGLLAGVRYSVRANNLITDEAGNALTTTTAAFVVAPAAVTRLDHGGANFMDSPKVAVSDDGASAVALWTETTATDHLLRYAQYNGTAWTEGTLATTLSSSDTFEILANAPVGNNQSFVAAINHNFGNDEYVIFSVNTSNHTFAAPNVVSFNVGRNSLLMARSGSHIGILHGSASSTSGRPAFYRFNGTSMETGEAYITTGFADHFNLAGDSAGNFFIATSFRDGSTGSVNRLRYAIDAPGQALVATAADAQTNCGASARTVSRVSLAVRPSGHGFLILCNDAEDAYFLRVVEKAASLGTWEVQGAGVLTSSGFREGLVTANDTNFAIVLIDGGGDLRRTLVTSDPEAAAPSVALVEQVDAAFGPSSLKAVAAEMGHAFSWSQEQPTLTTWLTVHREADAVDFGNTQELYPMHDNSVSEYSLVGQGQAVAAAYVVGDDLVPALHTIRFSGGGSPGFDSVVVHAENTRSLGAHHLFVRDGAIGIAWLQDRALKVKRALAQAAQDVGTPGSQGPIFDAAFCPDELGKTGLLVWQQADGAGYALFSREVNASGTLSSPQYASTTAYRNGFTDVKLTRKGSKVMMTYRDVMRVGTRNLWVRIYENGSWSEEQVLLNNAAQPYTPFVWDDRFGLVYQDNNPAPRSVSVLMAGDDDQFSLASAVEIETTQFGEISVSALAAADDVLLGWTVLGPGDIPTAAAAKLTSSGVSAVSKHGFCVANCSFTNPTQMIRHGNELVFASLLSDTSGPQLQDIGWLLAFDGTSAAYSAQARLNSAGTNSRSPVLQSLDSQLVVAWADTADSNLFTPRAHVGNSASALTQALNEPSAPVAAALLSAAQISTVELGVDNGVITAHVPYSSAHPSLAFSRLLSGTWTENNLALQNDRNPDPKLISSGRASGVFFAQGSPVALHFQRLHNGALLGSATALLNPGGNDYQAPNVQAFGPHRFAAWWIEPAEMGAELKGRLGL